jgi:cytochrome P450
LWPTTPAILRQSLQETAWDGAVMPKDTRILIFAPYFHRDGRKLEYADIFAPDVWLSGEAQVDGARALIPFSAGPARCPGREVVEATCAMVLAGVLSRCHVELDPPQRLDRHERMPGTLNPFTLSFELKKRE